MQIYLQILLAAKQQYLKSSFKAECKVEKGLFRNN